MTATTFLPGEKVRAKVTAQGLKAGDVYVVEHAFTAPEHLGFGYTVSYHVRNVLGGQPVRVVNMHLLVEEIR